MNATWEQLRVLREAGRKPALMVVITTQRWFVRGWDQQGVMCILHRPGEKFPVELLEGLEVLVWLDNCDQTYALIRHMSLKGVQAKNFHHVCKCYSCCDSWCRPCSETHEVMAWITSPKHDTSAAA